MSASQATPWTIRCNAPGSLCPARITGKPNDTVTELRRFLRHQGWATGIREGNLDADYCPRHKPQDPQPVPSLPKRKPRRVVT